MVALDNFADRSGNGNDLTLTTLPAGTWPVWFLE
jgi:hypothetical protein